MERVITMAKINFKKPVINVEKPKLPYLGKRVKKISTYVDGIKYEFLVQANKNHGICNVVSIDRVNNTLHRLPEVLSYFQGRQYDHPDTMYQLENYIISHVLNK